ncbi:MAG: hypothetical protein JNJ63_11390 [Hyphomonadaceae bacterium]|nr:hypothetical protein [Hyphomonadaceae bacterium]
MIRRTMIALLGALALASCASASAPAQQQRPVEITLQRTPCFGFCPDYTVTITGEGDVRYVGRRFVNVVGERHASIPRADVERLLQRFDAIGFDRLRDEYRAQVTDLPTNTITLTRNGRTKRVVDYGGTGAGMPVAVRELQAEIDRVAQTAQWVLRDGQPVRTPS